jgi:16S rRNA (guanine527-N7)-methyltransferase
MVLNTSDIQAKLRPYGVEATPDLCTSVQRYIALLLQWNKQISLTTVTDAAEVVSFHFGESLFAASAVPIGGGRLADVGSGAGFPGLALGLADPDLSVSLIESNVKKATFLSEIVRDLKLDHVTVARTRMQDFRSAAGGFDFVTARALGKHDELLNWASANVSSKGKVVLWLGEEDCATISRKAEWRWRDPIHIPGSKRRFLLVGVPNLDELKIVPRGT